MKSTASILWIILFIFIVSANFWGCKRDTFNGGEKIERLPVIYPDYTNVTIPYNIAPLNFSINEAGKSFEVVISEKENPEIITIKSSDGEIRFPEKKWKKILNGNIGGELEIKITCISGENKKKKEFLPFSLTDFHTEPVVENRVIEKNCVNCHSFNKNNPNEFLIHIRGSKGGTYFPHNGEIIKTNLKTDNMPGSSTYPAWHPGGRFVAFSSNQVRQSFYAHPTKSIEVYDLISSLILYDKQTNEITNITTRDTINPLQTFPAWSPDGRYLYFCRAVQNKTNAGRDVNDIKNIHYNLVRKSFRNNTKTFGETEMVFNASEQNKSVSFPRISPDGKFLVVTLQNYGTFPVWHEEADLYIINLQTNEITELNVNSNKTESYHAWSSNAKWLVFSSKRMDGRSARPFFTHIGSNGNAGKPFVLPQKDPVHYRKMLESFNIPELISDKIDFSPRNFANAAGKVAIQAKPGRGNNNLRIIKTENKNISEDKGIHE
jgi:Tol biopolymer transport system component